MEFCTITEAAAAEHCGGPGWTGHVPQIILWCKHKTAENFPTAQQQRVLSGKNILTPCVAAAAALALSGRWNVTWYMHWNYSSSEEMQDSHANIKSWNKNAFSVLCVVEHSLRYNWSVLIHYSMKVSAYWPSNVSILKHIDHDNKVTYG